MVGGTQLDSKKLGVQIGAVQACGDVIAILAVFAEKNTGRPGWAFIGKPDIISGYTLIKGPLFATNRSDPDWIWIASAHNLQALKRAETLGADALLLAPIFPTKSHPHRPALGISGCAKLAAATHLPVYALGGLTHENLKKLPPLKNLAGYAGISIFEK